MAAPNYAQIGFDVGREAGLWIGQRPAYEADVTGISAIIAENRRRQAAQAGGVFPVGLVVFGAVVLLGLVLVLRR